MGNAIVDELTEDKQPLYQQRAPTEKENGFLVPHDSYVPHELYTASDSVSNKSFSPEDGISCYPKQNICINRTGSLDNKWTNRVFVK